MAAGWEIAPNDGPVPGDGSGRGPRTGSDALVLGACLHTGNDAPVLGAVALCWERCLRIGSMPPYWERWPRTGSGGPVLEAIPPCWEQCPRARSDGPVLRDTSERRSCTVRHVRAMARWPNRRATFEDHAYDSSEGRVRFIKKPTLSTWIH